jgi:hypothetical protein
MTRVEQVRDHVLMPDLMHRLPVDSRAAPTVAAELVECDDLTVGLGQVDQGVDLQTRGQWQAHRVAWCCW